MTAMPAHIRSAYTAEVAAARDTADGNARWAHLERAHILSQPYPWPHTRNHIAMLTLRCGNAIAARPWGRWCGSSSPPRLRPGPLPEGNTGRTRAGLATRCRCPPTWHASPEHDDGRRHSAARRQPPGAV
ncbi:MAG TPA: DUF3703 domain-containing protein [Mycobacterium sp.]